MVLTSRVRDDRIREMAETFRSHASKRGGLSDRRGGLRGIARDSWNAGTAP
jgi:hypothetical protein